MSAVTDPIAVPSSDGAAVSSRSGGSDGAVPVPVGTTASARQPLGEPAAAAPSLFVEISCPGEAAAPAPADTAAASSCLAESWHHRRGVVAACSRALGISLASPGAVLGHPRSACAGLPEVSRITAFLLPAMG